MKELKANLDLYGVLLKLRECEKIFDEQFNINTEKSGCDYGEIQGEFYGGLHEMMCATKALIAESALNQVYDIIPFDK